MGGKKKNANASTTPQKQQPAAASKPSDESAKAEPEPPTPLQQNELAGDVVQQIEQLNLGGGGGGGAVEEEEKSREQIQAERKAKADAKKMKAEAAKLKKESEGQQQQAKPAGGAAAAPAPGGDKPREEVMAERAAVKAAKAAQKAAATAAKKQAGGGGQQQQNGGGGGQGGKKADSQQPAQQQQGKSALKQKQHGAASGQGQTKEVQFDLTSNTVKSGSEENLTTVGRNEEKAADPSLPPSPLPSTAHIHPAFLTLAVRCEVGLCDELDQLCAEFIAAFKQYLTWWTAERAAAADSSTLGHDLDQAIRPQLAHLTMDGRYPLPYALGNLVRQLKKEINKLGGGAGGGGEDGSLSDVHDWLDDCAANNLGLAPEAISLHLRRKMSRAGHVITYSWCPVVNRVLVDAAGDEAGKAHRYTVLDAQPNGRGLRHVRSLLSCGVRCDYGDLRALGCAIQNCSMVLLGCSAVLSNGCVAAPKGSLQVALAAKAFNVPLLVAAQTFKFVDKVQSYGRVALLSSKPLQCELVPSDLITAIVTELRLLPPTSAPAVLKAKALDAE